MNTMLQEVNAWIHRNARELELSQWAYFFESGSRESVLSAALMFRNADGGFGHAIESDNWNPDSTPIATLTAFQLLLSVGVEGTHPVMQGMLDYFASTAEDGVWHFTVPGNDAHPHAPWWSYSAESNAVQDMGVTAAIDALALRFASPGSGLYCRAAQDVCGLLSHAARQEYIGENGVSGLIALAAAAKEQGIGGWDAAAVDAQLHDHVTHAIEHDTTKWSEYGARPSNFIHAPASPFYEENREIVHAELDYLEKTRHPGGVWDITWTWFDNMAKYGAQFAVSENRWQAVKALENMLFLKKFGRLD